MLDPRTEAYAGQLARMIREETISRPGQTDLSSFHRFHALLRELFPTLFSLCVFEESRGSFSLMWKGRGDGLPILLMNHHDVVEAPGPWTHPPFSGAVAGGKLWGRGALDDKGPLWAMLRGAEELAAAGFVPGRDIWFLSTCTEEQDGSGADRFSRRMEAEGIRFALVLDEGGMILEEPIGGARGTFAMVGVGEKDCVDLKFIARSGGGHAATPGPDTPLVRLGKFMAAAEKRRLFRGEISPALHAMFASLSSSMSGVMKPVLGRSRLFAPLLVKGMPALSPMAGAMVRTTVAFTMAQGSQGTNVLPQEAWVIGNLRCSHHQGGEESIRILADLAREFDLETQVLDPGFPSPLSPHDSPAFRLVEEAVSAVFPGVKTAPYLMTGASDSRYLSRVCDHCLRFAPFLIDSRQLDSIHGIDENVDLSALAPAVDFYRYIITEASL